MKKYQILGFLILIVSSIGISQSNIYGVQDTDSDGVPNENDHCPNLQEDYQGIIDGCPSNFVPWYDADYDGIPDSLDTCPTVRETYNKFQDEDGCPDIAPTVGKALVDSVMEFLIM